MLYEGSQQQERVMMMKDSVECTVVVVGDSKIGKTALIHRLTKNKFKEEYTPTGFDKIYSSQEVNNHRVEFVLWDTSGCAAYDSVRSLSYQEANVFLLCYKISDPVSLYNVRNKWMKEIRRHRPDVPVVLCGCQSDLRNDPQTIAHLAKIGRTPVSSEQGLAICCEIEAVNYVETSAKNPSRDFFEAFEVCALAAVNCTFKTETAEDDVFPPPPPPSSSQPHNNKPLKTSSDRSVVCRRNEVVTPPAKPQRPVTLLSPSVSEPPNNAHVRANGLSRRTSFRSQRIHSSIPVSSPKSPLEPSGYELKSPHGNGNKTSFVDISTAKGGNGGVRKTVYESLKSHTSTGSTGSKSSTGSSVSSSSKREPSIPDTEDPELLNHLRFVSPKAGVFRPVASEVKSSKNKKQGCSIM